MVQNCIFEYAICLLSRYFLADNILDEVTFGWPRQKAGLPLKEHLASRLQRAISSVLYFT